MPTKGGSGCSSTKISANITVQTLGVVGKVNEKKNRSSSLINLYSMPKSGMQLLNVVLTGGQVHDSKRLLLFSMVKKILADYKRTINRKFAFYSLLLLFTFNLPTEPRDKPKIVILSQNYDDPAKNERDKISDNVIRLQTH